MNAQFFRGKKKLKLTMVVLLFILFSVFTVYAQILGDVNGSGGVDIVDALMVAQSYVGLSPPGFNSTYADVDANGSINIVDALLIAQYYVGIISVLPGENPPVGEEPTAGFEISNIVPPTGEVITYDASGSTDPDGTIVSYEWDFDDGTTGSGMIVTHFYTINDDYKVSLIVTDNDGLSNEIKERVFVGRPLGWTEDTHHKSAEPDYDLLLPDDKVNRIDITIASSDFQAMEDDLDGLDIMSDEKPMFIPVTLAFNGYTWWHVGMRYKGYSTLLMTGSYKRPFRLKMDKYEDDHLEIYNQRFYGFQKMTFGNNWYDAAFIRDVVTSDVFRNGGVPAAKGSFCEVYVDTGSGPEYWGLYTMMEDPSDKMPEVQFDDPDGNMYKPGGTGADWGEPLRLDAFFKKTNELYLDWRDIMAAHSALHSSRSDEAAWRAGLDAVFNVRAFLRCQAINSAIVNFDVYGFYAHNYYLYQDLSDNGRIVWFPWDFNMSFGTNTFNIDLVSLSLDEIPSSFPLIRYLMDDPVFNDIYHQELRVAIDGCFDADTVIAEIQRMGDLVRPSVAKERNGYTYLKDGIAEFDQAMIELIDHVRQRQTDVNDYLISKSY